MEKGRADYYLSRHSRAKINAQSKLFNCEASLMRSTPHFNERSMPHYFITGPCVCLGIVLRGSLIGGLVGGSLGGDLGGVLMSDGGWLVPDGGL